MPKKQNLNEEVIRSLSGQQNWLSMPRPYIDVMGSLEGGLMLSQMIYWSNKGSRADGYFWKSYKSWKEETSLSKYQVSKQVKIMKENKFLETKVVKVAGVPTLHYRFDFDTFQKWIVKKLHYRKSSNLTIQESEKTSLSNNTSNTTKTTAATQKTKTKDKSDVQITGCRAARGDTKPASKKFNFADFCRQEAVGLQGRLFPAGLRWTDNRVGFLRHALSNGYGGEACSTVAYINNKAALASAKSTKPGGWFRYFQQAVENNWSPEFTVDGETRPGPDYSGRQVRYQGAEYTISELGTLSIAGGVVTAGDVAKAVSSGVLEVL